MRAAALTGPTSYPNRRVTTVNAPGAEVGPGQVAAWGVVERDHAVGFEWSHDYHGGSSKHFPFDWRPVGGDVGQPDATSSKASQCECHA